VTDAPGFELREDARPDDPGRVRALVAATGFFNADEIVIAGELVEERLARGEPSGYRFVFAETPEGLAGYACYGPVPATQSSFALYWIAVAPGQQRRGLGRVLLSSVAAGARAGGGERLYADASSRPGNAPTLAFYAACGFARVAHLPDHYAPGDGKLILELVLAGAPAH
jgi:ribosomal protein S18 acetylase RimI-like enzyme